MLRQLAMGGGVAVALIALFTWMLTSWPGGSAAAPNPVAPYVAPPTSAGPSASADTQTQAVAPDQSGTRVLPLQNPPGYGWGSSATPHHLVLEVDTTARVFAYMGWRMPTAISTSGKTSMTGTHWSRAFTVYGAPYFAQFYVQYGPNTGAVTCRITVDGKQRAVHTGYGRYGGIWCFG